MNKDRIINCSITPGLGLVICNVLASLDAADTPQEKMTNMITFAALCSVAGKKIGVSESDKKVLQGMLCSAEEMAPKVLNERSGD